MKFQAVLLIVFVASAYQAIVLGVESPTGKYIDTIHLNIAVYIILLHFILIFFLVRCIDIFIFSGVHHFHWKLGSVP